MTYLKRTSNPAKRNRPQKEDLFSLYAETSVTVLNPRADAISKTVLLIMLCCRSKVPHATIYSYTLSHAILQPLILNSHFGQFNAERRSAVSNLLLSLANHPNARQLNTAAVKHFRKKTQIGAVPWHRRS